jgi:subtilisin family serine protease
MSWRRLTPTFLLFISAAVASVTSGDEPRTDQTSTGKPITVQVAPKGRPFAAGDWTGRKKQRVKPLTTRAASATGPTADQVKYLPINIEFQDAASCRAFQVEGVHVLSRFDRFADALMPVLADDKALKAVEAAPGIRWFEQASGSVVPPPTPIKPALETSRAAPAEIIRGGIAGLTGKGVIIAVIDSGIDFFHPDFIKYDQYGLPTSRVLYFWDTLREYRPGDKLGSPAPVTFANGAPIGVVYNRDELTADLRSRQRQITDCDTNGHGTACAGIAAGSGRGSDGQYTGVAPDADIIAVRIGDTNGNMVTEYLSGAICDWLERIAGSRPMVVSCSYGGGDGGHDGFTIEERQLDARFASSRQGRAICIAAGNDRTLNYHAGITIGGNDAPGKLNWNCPADADLHIYVDAGDAEFELTPADGPNLTDKDMYVHPLTNEVVIHFAVTKGTGGLTIVSKSGTSYRADAYVSDPEAKFVGSIGKVERMVGTPGTSASAITVGSYNWNDKFDHAGEVMSLADVTDKDKNAMTIGGLSGYSAPGYRRMGNAVKPEIVAPGQWYTAPAPLALASVDEFRDTSGRYQLFNGTSAATPYTAGIVALLLQKKPTITLGQIKDSLRQSATSDTFTGTIPNVDWGYGKLDADAVRRLLVGRYAVWVYKQVNGQWVRQDDRNYNTDDAQKATDYAASVNRVKGWMAKTNLTGK